MSFTRLQTIRCAVLTALASFVLACGMAAAADIVVSSATPSSAEQGTTGLLVSIKGSSFPKSVQVRFCVSSGDTTSCEQNGITVRPGSVKVKGTTTIDAIIDVAEGANVGSFDIEIIETTSGGRKGRGTALFSVLKKLTGVSLPPDPVYIEQVDAAANAVTLVWRAPRHPKSPGVTVTRYDVRYRAGSSPITEADFYLAAQAERSNEYIAQAEGNLEYFTVRGLQAGSAYQFAIKAVDANGLVSSLAYAGVAEVSGSRASVTTRAPLAGGWQVDTLEVVAESTVASAVPQCCSYESMDVASGGAAALAYAVLGNSTYPHAYRYAYLDGGSWRVEDIMRAALPEFRNGVMRHIPQGSPGQATPGAASAHVYMREPAVSKRSPLQSVLKYFVRQESGTWSSEEIRRDAQGGLAATLSGFDYFHDANDGWVPAVSFVDIPVSGVNRVVVAERRSLNGQAQWVQRVLFECRNTNSNQGIAGITDTVLRRDPGGALHIMARMNLGGPRWIVMGARDPADGSWTFQRSGTMTPNYIPYRFAVARDGSYAIAGGLDPLDDGVSTFDVALIESAGLYPVTSNSSPCDPPGAGETLEYTAIDSSLPGDGFLPEESDGSVVDTLSWASVSGIDFDYGPDGNATTPALHVFTQRSSGDMEIYESRVLSRCSPGDARWWRDPADRTQASGRAAMATPAPGHGIAWLYELGHAARTGGAYSPMPEERMMVARRAGNACWPQ
jgi:hypothetical protein